MTHPKTIAIVAAGEFPRSAAVLRLLDEADMIICCDSAAGALLEANLASCPAPTGHLADQTNVMADQTNVMADPIGHPGSPRKTRWEPDLVVGDLDSIPASLLERFPNRLRKVDEQEDNDLTKAFYAAMEFSPSCIHILGATGLREDHTLGNISLLARYQQEAGPSCRIDMVSDCGASAWSSSCCGSSAFRSSPRWSTSGTTPSRSR